jgi:hypothetical protein
MLAEWIRYHQNDPAGPRNGRFALKQNKKPANDQEEKNTEQECANPKCGKTNPVGQRFCGHCGKPTNASVAQLVEWAVTERLDALVRDRKVIEIESAATVTKKVVGWAKIYGWLIAIAGAILAASLAVAGFGTQADFQRKVAEVNAKLDKAVKDAQERYDEQSAAIANKGDAIIKKFEDDQNKLDSFDKSLPQFETQLAELQGTIKGYRAQVEGELQILKKRVDVIEEFPWGKLTPLSAEEMATIEATRGPYRKYLMKLGFKGTDQVIPIYSYEGERVDVFYLTAKEVIYVHKRLITDINTILNQSTYPILWESMNEALRDESGGAALMMLKVSLMDYFPCSYLNSPIVGETFVKEDAKTQIVQNKGIRNLDNVRNFDELTEESAPQEAAEVFGGAFWALRQRVTRDGSDPLIAGTWSAAKPADYEGTPSQVAARLRDLLIGQDRTRNGGKNISAIKAVFEARGIKP